MAKSKISFAVLHFGYVESFGLASLVLSTRNRRYFESPKEAKESLAKDLLLWYKYEKGIKDTVRDCCKKYEDCNFCADCGRNIESSEDIDVDAFKNWMYSLLSADIDSSGGCFNECEDEATWELGFPASSLIGKKASEVICLDEQGEEEVCRILGLEED